MNRELRIKTRKIGKLEIQITEFKNFMKSLQELYSLPEQVNKAIIDMGDKFDKFNSPENEIEPQLLDESVLYLSSNWSARMSLKT